MVKNLMNKFIGALGNGKVFGAGLQVRGQELKRHRKVIGIKICDNIFICEEELHTDEYAALKECARENRCKIISVSLDTIWNIKTALREGDIDYIDSIL